MSCAISKTIIALRDLEEVKLIMKIHYEIGCGFLVVDVADSEVVPWLCGKGCYIYQGVGNTIENANSVLEVIHLVQTNIFH